MEAPPDWSDPNSPPPIVPSLLRRDDKNPFDDDDFKTVADVIPANAEASRSLSSEPSWRIARQSASLGELQRWVQESRTPPKSRWEAFTRQVKPLHLRVTGWAQQRRLPRWAPYAGVAVVLLWTVLLLVKCSSGGHADRARPAPDHGPAKAEPRTGSSGGEIEMDEDAVRPDRKR